MSERFKSILLVVLCISMIGLFAVNLTLALDGGTELFTIAPRHGGGSDASESQSPAIMPEKLGISGSSGLKMASGSEYSETFLSVYPMLTEALGSVKKLESVTEDVFTGYLAKQGIYVSFSFPVPLCLLQYCWTGEMTQTGDQAVSVMKLAVGKGTVELAFYDGSTGRFYAAATAGGYERMAALCEGTGDGTGYFAGWADDCDMIQPWDMLSAASEYYPSYSVSTGDLAAEGGRDQPQLLVPLDDLAQDGHDALAVRRERNALVAALQNRERELLLERIDDVHHAGGRVAELLRRLGKASGVGRLQQHSVFINIHNRPL